MDKDSIFYICAYAFLIAVIICDTIKKIKCYKIDKDFEKYIAKNIDERPVLKKEGKKLIQNLFENKEEKKK